MKKIVPEKIIFQLIQVLKSSVTTTDDYQKNPVKPRSIRVSFAQNTAFIFETRKVRIRLDVILDGTDLKNQDVGLHGEFEIEFHLQVKNLNDFVIEQDGQKLVDGLLGETLMGIVYSTARGIILDRTFGTLFEGAIIPVIAPKDLLKIQSN